MAGGCGFESRPGLGNRFHDDNRWNYGGGHWSGCFGNRLQSVLYSRGDRLRLANGVLDER